MRIADRTDGIAWQTTSALQARGLTVLRFPGGFRVYRDGAGAGAAAVAYLPADPAALDQWLAASATP